VNYFTQPGILFDYSMIITLLGVCKVRGNTVGLSNSDPRITSGGLSGDKNHDAKTGKKKLPWIERDEGSAPPMAK
jgi:hypothetical protein